MYLGVDGLLVAWKHCACIKWRRGDSNDASYSHRWRRLSPVLYTKKGASKADLLYFIGLIVP